MTGAKLVAAALVTSAKVLAAAIRELAHRGDHMCCSEHTIVVERNGEMFWRRHEWNADDWAPLGTPGATKRHATAERSRRKTPT